MRQAARDFFLFYTKYVLTISSTTIIITMLVLIVTRRLSVVNLLNIMFLEGSIFMGLGGVMSIFRLSRVLFNAKLSGERTYSIEYSWFFFSISITIFVVLFLIHFLAKLF